MSRFPGTVLVLSYTALSSIGCYEVSEPRCVRADLTAFAPDPYKGMALPSAAWFKDAMVCSIGDYRFSTPADGSAESYMVLSADGAEVVRLDAQHVAIHDGFDLHIMMRDRNEDGVSDEVSYMTWKYGGDRMLSAVDSNIDGQPDHRTVELIDGSTRHEVWAENTWHHVALSDGLRLVADPTRRARLREDGTYYIVEE